MRETIGEALYFQYYLARNFSLQVRLGPCPVMFLGLNSSAAPRRSYDLSTYIQLHPRNDIPLSGEFHVTPRSLQRRAIPHPWGNFAKQSCLFTLNRLSICKLLSNSAPSRDSRFLRPGARDTGKLRVNRSRAARLPVVTSCSVVKKVTERTPIPQVLLFRSSFFTWRVSKIRNMLYARVFCFKT